MLGSLFARSFSLTGRRDTVSNLQACPKLLTDSFFGAFFLGRHVRNWSTRVSAIASFVPRAAAGAGLVKSGDFRHRATHTFLQVSQSFAGRTSGGKASANAAVPQREIGGRRSPSIIQLPKAKPCVAAGPASAGSPPACCWRHEKTKGTSAPMRRECEE